MANTITPTTAVAYILTNGTIRDESGWDSVHPNSTVNQVIIYVEDGDSDNVMTINYNPEVRKKWATHWFPLFYRGLVEHTLDGESEARTFAQYQSYVPTILSAMNINSSTAMEFEATVRQQAGNNLIGAYATVDDLPTSYGDWEDLQDLEENNVVAYVYEAGVNGFYMVEFDDPTYSWELQTSGITNYVTAKPYDTISGTILGGFSNPDEITELTDEQYRLIWQELSSVAADIVTNEDDISDILDGTTAVGKAVADQNGNVINTTYQTLANLVTAFQVTPDDTHYISEKLAKDQLDLKQTLTNLVTSWNDTPLDTTYPSEKLVKDTTDAIEVKADALISANMIKSLARTGTDLVTITYYDNTTATVVTLAQLKAFIGEASDTLSGLMSSTDKSRFDFMYALITNEAADDVDSIVDTVGEILEIFESYPEGADLVTALAGKVGKAQTIAGVDMQDNITKEELRTALEIENIDNTSDEDKPISTAQQAEFDNKVDKETTIAGVNLENDIPESEMRSALSINNVDNTSDEDKPVSTAQQTALNLKRDNDPTTLPSATADGTDILNVWNINSGQLEQLSISGLLALIASGTTTFVNSADYKQYGLGAFKTAVQTVHVATLNTGAQAYVNIKTVEQNQLYYVEFPTITSTNDTELSVDNQSNYYDLVTQDGFNISGTQASGKKALVYYDGSNFVALNIFGLAVKNVAYAGAQGKYTTGANGVDHAVTKKVNAVPSDIRGRTLEWLVNNPNLQDSLTSDDSGTIIDIEVDGQISFGATTYDSGAQLFNIISGVSYYIKIKLDNSSTGDIQNKIRIVYDDDNTDVEGDSTKGYTEVAKVITATQSGSANIKFNEGNAGTIVKDYIIAIPLPSDISTASEMEQLLDGYIHEKGIHSVGEAITLDQLLDNRNEFGAWTDTTTSTDQDNVPVIAFNYDSVPYYTTTISSGTYTVLYRVYDNTLNQALYVDDTAFGSASDTTLVASGTNAVGHTTAVSTGGTSFKLDSTATSGSAEVQVVLFSGDYTDLFNTMSEEELLDIIKYQEYGTFDISGLRWNTVGKNKFDGKLESGVYSLLTGLKTENSSYVRSNNRIKINALFNYTMSRDFSTEFVFMYYDEKDNIISNSGTTATTIQLVIPSNAKYFRFYTFTTDTDKQIQIELGTTATTYEPYEETYAKLEGELHGIGGVYDDETTQRFDVDYNDVLQSATSWGYTDVGNVDRFNKDLSILGYKPPVDLVTASIGALVIGDDFFTPLAITDISTADAGYYFTVRSDDSKLYIALPDTLGITTSGAFETYLQANDVTFIYELDEYIPRTEANNNLTPITGEHIVSQYSTWEMYGQGVIDQFDITSAYSLQGQVDILTKVAIKQGKKDVTIEERVERAETEIDTLESEVRNSGVTADRPSDPYTGQFYFDTTLGQPIWYDGSGWVDADGTTA